MAYYALIPFIITIIVVLITMNVVNWLTNKKIDKNLLSVGIITQGTFSKDKEKVTLKGIYKEKNYTVSVKHRGVGKNKVLFYHVLLENVTNIRFLCIKNYAKSRLESKVNQMTKVASNDCEFDSVNMILSDNKDLAERLVSDPVFIHTLKEIMQKYSEVSIKKDITLLKRYHVTLTETEVLLSTLDKLILLTNCLENIVSEKV